MPFTIHCLFSDNTMDKLKSILIDVVRLAGTHIDDRQIDIIDRACPHKPESLPAGKMGIYMFKYRERFLKIGKAGPKSNARFLSQHYNPDSSNSNLAKYLINDNDISLGAGMSIGEWIRTNVHRIDMLLDASLGIHVLSLLEAFLHCRFNPKYEGFQKQR